MVSAGEMSLPRKGSGSPWILYQATSVPKLQAELQRTVGAQRNAGQEGLADVCIHMGAIGELFRANDVAGVETQLLHGGRLASTPHTASVLTDILQAGKAEQLYIYS